MTSDATAPRAAGNEIGYTWLDRCIVALCAVVGIAVMRTICGFTDIPGPQGFSASVLLGSSPVVISLILMIIGSIAATALGWMAGNRLHIHAGVFAAGVGLAAVSVRGGSILHVYQAATSRSVFIVLLIEVIILGLIIACCMLFTHRVLRRGTQLTSHDSYWSNDELMALAVHSITMGVITYVLAQTLAKNQALAAVGIGAFVGTIAAVHAVENATGRLLWLGPIIVGTAGYLMAWFDPGDFNVGRKMFHLAHAAPLDYAGLGVAATFYALWPHQRKRLPLAPTNSAPAHA